MQCFRWLSGVHSVRVRSFSSMRQHEQQQIAASLRGPRGPGLFRPQHHVTQQSARPLAPSISVNDSSTSRVPVKFTPNVAVKQETASGATAAPTSSSVASGFSVDALLLRSLHSQQPSSQVRTVSPGKWRLEKPQLYFPSSSPRTQSFTRRNGAFFFLSFSLSPAGPRPPEPVQIWS